jgi:hypothetical protein
MKKYILPFLIMAAGALSVAAQSGPVYSPQTLALDKSTLQTVLATGTTNFLAGNVIYVQKQKDVAVQIYFKLSDSDTANQTFVFQRSVDGVNYESLSAKMDTIVVAATGATASITVTNINTYGAGYIKLKSIQNGSSTGNLTNLVISYGVKINAP